nr:glycoside hydrolase family 36 N-terminal domain-containing protein [Angustibacter aerolatus]
MRVTQQARLEPSGVVRLRHVVTATSAAGFSPQGALAMLPVPMLATEVLDCTGRWTRERTPQRGPLLHGQHARENRRGRTGHDATTMLVAGTAGFGWRTGQVWGAHVAWSGDQVHVVDRVPEGTPCSAAASCCAPARCRRPRGVVHRALDGAGLVGRGPRRRERAGARPAARAARPPEQPAAGGAEHLGGRVLRPRPRPAHRAWPGSRRPSASSASCWTTGGSARGATTPAGSATGPSRPRCGPTG